MQSTLVVPLRNKGEVIGALNLLSSDRDAFDDTDEAMLRAFAAPIAQAIVNARLFESEREYSDTMETLAEVGREMSGILDLDELLTRVAHLVKRVIAYRTFGIALVNDDTGMVEFKVAISYGEASASSAVKVGEGLLGYAVQHKEVVLVPDVAQDPRYINAVPDAKSELVVPLLVKDRCIGAFDLESPELNAFSKRHVELLTLLASEAAVAIENARLWEELRANELRIEKELRFAQRVQMALLPRELPKQLRVGGRVVALRAGARTRRRPLRVPRARAESAHRGRRRRLGQGRARGALQRVRRRGRAQPHVPPPAPRRRRRRPGPHAHVDQPHPPRAPARGVLLHALLRHLRPAPPHGDDGQLRPAVSDPLFGRRHEQRADRAARRAARLVRHAPPTTRSWCRPTSGDVFAFCSDGISETFSESGAEFGSRRIAEVVRAHRDKPAAEIVEQIFQAMSAFRGNAEQTDDQTVVVVRILA